MVPDFISTYLPHLITNSRFLTSTEKILSVKDRNNMFYEEVETIRFCPIVKTVNKAVKKEEIVSNSSCLIQARYEFKNYSVGTTIEIISFELLINAFLFEIIEHYIKINIEMFLLWRSLN